MAASSAAPVQPERVTVQRAMQITGLKRRHIQSLAQQGKIPGVAFGPSTSVAFGDGQ